MDERTYQDIIDDADVAQFFPKLVGNYRKTSPATLRYNCLAWALRIDWLWFQHEARTAGYYWPPGIEREWSISSIRKILEVHGYAEEAGNAEVESGYEKVAFYVDRSNEPTHFARQLENGKWTSKLGDLVDIEHDDLECLEGDEQYGSVLCILKRRIVSLT
jgi:hypothetical protein